MRANDTDLVQTVHPGVVVCQHSMARDQLNSRFNGRDIFREIDLLP